MKYAIALLFTGANAAMYHGGWNSAPASWSAPGIPSPTAPVEPNKPYSDTWTTYTDVVTAVTTYCPSPTEIVHNSKTYTVTTATTLTITNCPCTLTYSSWSSSTPTTTEADVVIPTMSVYTTPIAPYSYSNTTSITPDVPYTPSSPPVKTDTTSPPPLATVNAASNKVARAGAALAGVFGVVVYLL